MTRTQNPLYLQFLTFPIEKAETLQKGKTSVSLETVHSNIFELKLTGNTQLRFDMELVRTALRYQYGLSDKIELGIEIPFLSNTAGFLDPFIQWYHKSFGFPNGGRELFPDNEFAFQLSQGCTTLFQYQETAFVPSDILIRGKIHLFESQSKTLNISFAPVIKLPSGLFTNGFSSGHVDVGGQFLLSAHWKRFHSFTQLGGAFISGHKVIGNLTKKGFAQFGQSFELQLLDAFSVIVQLTGNTSLFKGVDANDLTQIILDLNVGFAGRIPIKSSKIRSFFYQFSFAEDVMGTGPSIDFSSHFLAGIEF